MELLSLGRTISDFSTPVEADSSLEDMVGFPLVQPNLSPALQINVAQPIEHEGRALQTADFSKSQRQAVLTWIGGEFPKDLTRHDGSSGHTGSEPQNIGPIFTDQPDIDPSADQRLKSWRQRIGSGGVKPLVRQIADSRRKSESEDGANGEHMVRKAAGIDMVLTDLPSSVILQQPSRI